MNRNDDIGRSMPRKSKHGKKIARWGTHQEVKELRSKYAKK
jgi:hypothetical protein